MDATHDNYHLAQTLRSLGRIGQLTAQEQQERASLQWTNPSAPALNVRFPQRPSSRRLDPELRLKFQSGANSLSTLLGWRDGTLDATLICGWMVLSQRPEQIGADRGRNSPYAGFSVDSSGLERICLRRPQAMHLGVAGGDELLVAPLPESNSLVIVDLMQIAPVAPDRVRALLAAA